MAPLRVVARYFEISKSSVFKTLKEFKYKAYKFTNHQQLFPEDKEKRTEFCETMFNILNEREDILEKILFTDEASFTLNGKVNSQNFRWVLSLIHFILLTSFLLNPRYWSRTNPHVQNITHTQYRNTVNVWAGIINDRLVGPFFIDGNLTSVKFVELLRNHIFPALENLAINEPWFQMDGAPPHSTNAVTNLLNHRFPGRWIGRFGPIPWAPRSPDLSPNDFFLWGYLHNTVYNNVEIQNLDELKERIRIHCGQINPDFLRNSVRGFQNRLGYCLEVEGGHFEHLL